MKTAFSQQPCSGSVGWVACPLPALPSSPGCPSVAAMLGECGPKGGLFISSCFHSLPRFSPVPRRILVRLFRPGWWHKTQMQTAEVLVTQDKRLESSPWWGSRNLPAGQMCSGPRGRQPTRKLLEDINFVVTELGPGRWFWNSIVKIRVGRLALTFKSLRRPRFLPCTPPQTQSTEAGLSQG